MRALESLPSQLSLDGYGPAVLMVVAALTLLCWQTFRIKMDPREPPLLRPWIPFVGHLIGMIRHHQNYFVALSIKNPGPVFALPIFTSKMYVINSPELQQVTFRLQTLSFDPFVIEFGDRMVGAGPEAVKKMTKVPEDPKKLPFMKDFHKALHEHMTPGPKLQQMNANMLKTIAKVVNGVQDETKDSLYIWLRNTFTEATATALFGSNNPWTKDKSLIDSFWDFEKNILFILLGFFPSLVAPKAYKGRQDNQTALQAYFAAGHNLDPDVSPYARARVKSFRDSGFNTAEVGKFEIADIHVAVSNAVPSFFWLLLFIVSDPQLKKEIRAELSKIVTATGEGGKRELVIDIGNVSESCPLLLSAYRETLRLTNSQIATRFVTEDAVLSDGRSSFLLRKGATLQMPSGVMQIPPLYGALMQAIHLTLDDS